VASAPEEEDAREKGSRGIAWKTVDELLESANGLINTSGDAANRWTGGRKRPQRSPVRDEHISLPWTDEGRKTSGQFG
jgi:hypothetical protein